MVDAHKGGLWQYLIPAISDIGSSVLGTALSRRATKESHVAADQAEDKAWDRQTHYNHPSQQIARLREAGLNPRLLYSAGTSSAGQATPAVHQRNPYSYQDKVQNFLSNQLAAAQIRSLDVETAYKKYENELLAKNNSTRNDPFPYRFIGKITKEGRPTPRAPSGIPLSVPSPIKSDPNYVIPKKRSWKFWK